MGYGCEDRCANRLRRIKSGKVVLLAIKLSPLLKTIEHFRPSCVSFAQILREISVSRWSPAVLHHVPLSRLAATDDNNRAFVTFRMRLYPFEDFIEMCTKFG
jgi:hypothetical protein